MVGALGLYADEAYFFSVPLQARLKRKRREEYEEKLRREERKSEMHEALDQWQAALREKQLNIKRVSCDWFRFHKKKIDILKSCMESARWPGP